MPRHLPSRRAAAAVLVALMASAAVAACGGSRPADTGAASLRTAGLQYAACIRGHGVPDFPDPSATAGAAQTDGTQTSATLPPPLSESAAVVQRAEEECRRFAEAAAGPVVSRVQLAKLKAGALAYAKCVRAHGVPDFPDPTVEPGPGGHGAGISPPYGSGVSARTHATPALKAAIATCSSLVEKVMPGG